MFNVGTSCSKKRKQNLLKLLKVYIFPFPWSFSLKLAWCLLLTMCYRLNVCVPPKFICWNLIPNVIVFGGGAFGRRLVHEDGRLMIGISVLIKAAESSLSFCNVRTQWKVHYLWARKGFSPDTKSASALTLDSPAPRTVRYITVVYTSLSLWYFVRAAQME